MKICHISDTHNNHNSIIIDDVDVLICSGDISDYGEQDVVEDFILWMAKQKAKHKILTFGNHEVGYSNLNSNKTISALKLMQQNNIHYLNSSSVVLDGLKYYGSPASKKIGNFEWNYNPGKDIEIEWNKIPLDTNILITHQPPYNILDKIYNNKFHKNIGCLDLLNKIKTLKNLKAHCFGHIHDSGGIVITLDNVIYSNGAMCNNYNMLINQPNTITINE